MYYEARGEGEEGQKAVAEVIFHRMNTGNYGHSICAVVYEGVATGTCQFSFACDGVARRQSRAGRLERSAGPRGPDHGRRRELNDVTGGAVSFHAVVGQPGWARTYVKTVQIGNHIFYRRNHARLSGACGRLNLLFGGG